ncbi:MAG: hypothetical protein WDN00_17710 [Limisphaerales bacterium]
MIFALDYASPSVFESDRDRALLGMSANARRRVHFHGQVMRNIPLLRFVLRALGEAIWSNDTWVTQGELMSWILDPVITVHPDRVFFEAFSQDQSVYAMVVANPEMFATDGEIVTGTTNVDFSAWLWGALNELRSSRETWLRVGAQGFEVKTKGAGGRFEQKVELPDSWVRGFLQVSSAMAMPGTRICRQGRAVFDVESRDFRHRELFEQPVDEAKFFPPDERLERAKALLAKNAVPFARCEPQETRKTKKLKTPDGPITREIVYRDWRVTGNVATEKRMRVFAQRQFLDQHREQLSLNRL